MKNINELASHKLTSDMSQITISISKILYYFRYIILSLVIFSGLAVCVVLPVEAFSQSVGIGASAFTPDESAILDVSSINQGFLMPRMTTTQRNGITSPATGLFIFNTTTNCFEAYVNGAWNTVSCPAACNPPATPTATSASSIGCTSFTANWAASTEATYYYLDVSTNSGFGSLVTGYNNLNVGNVTSLSVTGLNTATDYYYRVRATTACISGNSNTIGPVTTTTAPSAPTASTHTHSQTQIGWNWNAASGATGYKWSTTDVYSSATDNGANTTKTQTGLTCSTPNTLYVWAYNACGENSTTTTLTQTTSSCCTADEVPDGSLTKTIICDGNYTVIKWTYSSSPGSTTWTIPSGVTSIEYLVVAGGGAGGGSSGTSGGGGAGGLLYETLTGLSGSVTVIVGAGGTATTGNGNNGGNSSFYNITATGGGGGAGADEVAGLSGGSGGGGAANSGIGGAGNTPHVDPHQGNNGGAAAWTGSKQGGGGGGGYGSAGGNSGTTAGDGGTGYDGSAILGHSAGTDYFAGGGGGGGRVNYTTPAGIGGSNVGGHGGYGGAGVTSGAINTGSGGGGVANTGTAGSGGSGIVIIRYLNH